MKDKIKKRLLVVSQLPPPIHGSTVMTEMFIKSLENIDQKYCLVQKKFNTFQENIGKPSVLKILKIPWISFQIIKSVILEKPVFCVYFISVKHPTFFIDAFFLYLINLLGLKYILYIHAIGLNALSRGPSKFLNLIVKKTLNSAFGAIILGDNLRKDINTFIPDCRIFKLHNAIDDLKDNNTKVIKRENSGITVLFLSNLRPSKGTFEVLEVAKNINEKHSNVKFILAGPHRSIAFQKKLKQFIKEEKLCNIIKFTGAVYGYEKEKLFRESDIFFFPTHNDAFGLVNLEALKFGLPVLTTNVGAIPEIIHHGINGYTVDPKNVKEFSSYLTILIEDKEKRRKMGLAGRKIYEELYTPSVYQKRLGEIMDRWKDIN